MSSWLIKSLMRRSFSLVSIFLPIMRSAAARLIFITSPLICVAARSWSRLISSCAAFLSCSIPFFASSNLASYSSCAVFSAFSMISCALMLASCIAPMFLLLPFDLLQLCQYFPVFCYCAVQEVLQQVYMQLLAIILPKSRSLLFVL